jgi:outer membrane receptor protein involved in Fe transport
VRLSARWGAAALALALVAAPGTAFGQTVTGNFRGRVLNREGVPVASATVTARNTETGLSRSTLTDAQGRYLLLGLSLGPYAVRAQAIGHRPLEKTGLRLQIGAEVILDFSLEATAIELTAVSVEVEQVPLVDPGKTGTNTRISQDQIEGLPTNGRNFTDFIGLAPTFAKIPAFGAGAGGGSIGGGRSGANLIQIDGVQNTGTFFGGDPRGSDRLPIAFSIEAVKEFQVLTNEYDVSKGGFTGGVVNAVTKSGTNELHGTFFEYYRSQDFTSKDFVGNDPTDFLSHQFGATLSGPVIRDKLHFFTAVDRQARNAPVNTLTNSVTGVADSLLARLDSIITNVYGIDPGQRGVFTTLQNEWVLFGRVDWNINTRHRLAIRDSYTALDFSGDRVVTTDYSSNGGPLHPKANSLVANVFSNFSPTLYNELRFQAAVDKKARPPAVTYPQVRVVLNGSAGNRTVAFGADSIIHFNNLEERTLQIADVVTYVRGAHTVQLGTDNIRYKFFNLFMRNGFGTYTFDYGSNQANLDSMITRHASRFTRQVPVSGVSPIQFPDSIVTANYSAWNYSFYLQDRWQVNDRLTVNAGVRLDVPKVSGAPRNNPRLLDSFPQFFLDSAGVARIRGGTGTAADSQTTSREVATQYDFSPRIGFAYDVWGDRRTVLRGGVGIFHGYTPFVFWSNMFLGTGRDLTTVNCAATSTATQNVDLAVEAPLNCGAASAQPKPEISFFSRDYRSPYAVKTNFGFDHGVTPSLAVGAEVVYAKTHDNFTNRDVNYRTTNPLVLTGEGGRQVWGNTPGASGSTARRIDTTFVAVLVHENKGTADYAALIGSVRYRTPRLDLSGTYTYSRNRDNYSRSCCISFSQYAAIEAGANGNFQLGGNFGYAENDIPHQVKISALWRAPYGFHINALWLTFSGRPYTPRIASNQDANGDGINGNDRAYVPRTRTDISIDGNAGGAGFGTAAQQDSAYAVLDGIINGNACLFSQRGRIAARMSCRNAARSVLDIKISRQIPLISGQTLELTADFFNVLNGLSKKWGKATEQGDRLMRIRGFDAVNNRYVYEVDGSFGRKSVETNFGASLPQFQAQFGARYRF